MKNKKLTLLCSIGLVLVLLLSAVLAACAQETAAPGSPTKISPQVPSQPSTTPSTPSTPAKPAPAPAAEVIEWDFSSNSVPGATEYESQKWWTELVEEGSYGRFKIKMHPAAEIVKAVDHLDALRSNLIQASHLYGGYWKEFLPEAGIEAAVPMQYRNTYEMSHVFWELGLIDLIREGYAEHGCFYLAPWCYGEVTIWATRPLRTLDDFNGLKIRAAGDIAEILGEWGASTTFIPTPEIYTALQLGTIDAASVSITWYGDSKEYEVAPYLMMPGFVPVGIGGHGLSIPALNELPDDLRDYIISQGPALEWKCNWMNKLGDVKVLNSADELGFEVVYWDDEVIQSATEGGVKLLRNYAEKSERCAKAVAIIEGFMKEMGYIQ